MKKIFIILIIFFTCNINISHAQYINNISSAVNFIKTHGEKYNIDVYYKKINNSEKELLNIGFYYDEKDNNITCSDKLINKNNIFSKEDEIFLKNTARAIKIIEEYLEYNNDNTGEIYLTLAVGYFLKNKFYSFDKILENIKKYKSLNKSTEKPFTNLKFIDYILDFKGKNVIDLYNHAVNNNYIDEILISSGYLDIYNDGFFDNFKIFKKDTYSILWIPEEKLDDNNKNLYLSLFNKVFPENKNNLDDIPLTCESYLYTGNLYILPFDNINYIINTTEVENNIKSIFIKNPAYFNLNYNNKNNVSYMANFSYNDNIIYEVEYDREPLSPAGDVDNLNNVYNFNNPLTYFQLKDYIKTRNYEKAIKNYDYNQREINKFYEYVSRYYKEKITPSDYYLLFYDIGKDVPIYMAKFTNKNNSKSLKNNKKSLYFFIDKKFKVVNEELAKNLSEFINDELFYEVKIIYKNKNPNIIFLKRNGEVFVVNFIGENAGFNSFPAYFTKNKYEKKSDEIRPLFHLYNEAEIDCRYAENQNICTSREFLSQKAYINVLYKEKLEIMKNYYYPENIKNYYISLYENLEDEIDNCYNHDEKCIRDLLFKYIDIFSGG